MSFTHRADKYRIYLLHVVECLTADTWDVFFTMYMCPAVDRYGWTMLNVRSHVTINCTSAITEDGASAIAPILRTCT